MCHSVTPREAVGRRHRSSPTRQDGRPMTTTDRDMLWSGWGDPERAAPLPDAVTGLLRDLLGVKPREAATVALEDLPVPASPLTPDAHRALAAALGDDAHVRT